MSKISKICACVIFILGCSSEENISLTPEQAMQKFYQSEVAEDQIMDPLILAGEAVVPLILEDLQDKNMLRRRYAIGALGNIGSNNAIAALRVILEDHEEKDYFRCDSLDSIAMISIADGKNLAAEITQRPDDNGCLSLLAKEIIQYEGSSWKEQSPSYRSYNEARRGIHR